VLVNSSGQRDLLSLLGTRGTGELQLCNIGLGSDDFSARSGRANVDHEDFVLGKLSHLRLLAVGGLHTEETAQKEEVDFEIGVDVGELTLETEDVTDETVGTAKGGVNTGTDTCQWSILWARAGGVEGTNQ
jgi:hypothetical protein